MVILLIKIATSGLYMLEIKIKNIPVSGTLLRSKTREITTHLNIENFSASSGWLERFKKNA